MKAFLISANLETKPAPVYPLGLGRLATALREQGHEVQLYDLLVHGEASLASALSAFQPQIIGVSLRNSDNTESEDTQTYLPAYQSLVKRLRELVRVPIILGGPAYSIFPEELLQYLDADYGIQGPGEMALIALLGALAQNHLPPDLTIPGVFKNQGGRIISSGPNQPRPRKNKITREADLIAYYWEKGGSLNLQTRLGCWHQCVYCTYPLIDGPGTTTFSPRELAEEARELKTRYGITHFFIVDSVFNLDEAHAREVADAFIQYRAEITWTCFCEPGKISPGFLERLAQAGCTHIEFGTDSLSDQVLAAYGKPFRLAEIEQWSQAAAQAHIHQAHFLILGGPGETPATVEETLAASQRLRPAVFFPYLGMRIFPNTPLHELAKAQGYVPAGQSLLKPIFYFSPATSQAWLGQRLNQQARQDPRWVTPEKWKQAGTIMQRLRAKGKKGPLWDYLVG